VRTALVGGSSKGLGLACARALAAENYRVVLCARNRDVLENAARDICTAEGTEVIAIRCDLSKRESLATLKDELTKRNLQVDILINNVGGPPPGVVTELSEAEWEYGLDLLFRSTVRLYNMFLPGMRERKWGRIVNILSTTAVEPVSTLAVSSVLRAAIASYAKLVAWEVARDGVIVNSVMPGGFRTARAEALALDLARRRSVTVERIRNEKTADIPIQRLLEPEELGHLMTFLVSDEAAAIVGALIPIDGGVLKSLQGCV